MPADSPTILATSGGIRPGRRVRWEFAPLVRFAVGLAGVTGRAPRICGVMTASGDPADGIRNFYDAATAAGWTPSHLALFPMPNVADVREHLLAQDVMLLGGQGSIGHVSV